MTGPVIAVREAQPRDVRGLLAAMEEFYAESGYVVERATALQAFATLLADGSLGRVWVAAEGEALRGYLVLTLGFSMEWGGRDAFVDDLFVRARWRGQGLGGRLLDAALAECRLRGVRAIHLEVASDNATAKALYARRGFAATGRELLTLRLR